jgi:3-hydroxyisobutyrate dehydrogenase-like beta-hydroxyacid dehydrogenase
MAIAFVAEQSEMKHKVIGFLGLGTMGFPMCYNLFKDGYPIVLPTFRMEIDANSGFSPLVPDYKKKKGLIEEMLRSGVTKASSLKELVGASDIILMSMPTSKQVEELVLASDGILLNARKGTIVIDLTSADPASTKKINLLMTEKEIEMLDAPVSGGVNGAINQTLAIMVGGKEAVFKKCRPIFNVIGKKEKIFYVGPSGAGHTLKVANNFLSSCCLVATTEAIMVAAKAGISPQRAVEVISNSGGRSDATMNKYPNCVLPDKEFNFALNLMSKDIGLFTQVAKELQVPAFLSNIVHQLWGIPIAKGEGEMDMMNIIKMYEQWCGVKLRGTADDKPEQTQPR